MKMEKPAVETVRLNSADVIATSGGSLALSNVGDGNPDNNEIILNGTHYGRSEYDAAKTAFETAFPIIKSTDPHFWLFVNKSKKGAVISFPEIFLNTVDNSSPTLSWDYEYDPIYEDFCYIWYKK